MGWHLGMENADAGIKAVSYCSPKTKMKVRITFTNEKTLEEAEWELLPISEGHCINRFFGKDAGKEQRECE